MSSNPYVLKESKISRVLFPQLSNKCRNIVRISIPKNSKISLHCSISLDELSIVIESNRFERDGAYWVDEPILYDIGEEVVSAIFTPRGDSAKIVTLDSFSQSDDSMMNIFEYVTETFNNHAVSLKFENGSCEEFAMQLLRYCQHQQAISLSKIEFELIESHELFREVLERCVQQNTVLDVSSQLPPDFEYTPPAGGFKFKTLTIDGAVQWFDLNDFLQCTSVSSWSPLPRLTPQYLNKLFKQIINMESRLERLHFKVERFTKRDFSIAFKDLSDR